MRGFVKRKEILKLSAETGGKYPSVPKTQPLI